MKRGFDIRTVLLDIPQTADDTHLNPLILRNLGNKKPQTVDLSWV
ncbi:hypothetical protein QT970_27065 [Microcoleus sp. herbarium8]